MGYAAYVIERPNGIPMKRGYAIHCKCHQRGCTSRIDRGVAYLCYCCTWYFCSEHLTVADAAFDCFAGQSDQACIGCAAGDAPAERRRTDAQ